MKPNNEFVISPAPLSPRDGQRGPGIANLAEALADTFIELASEFRRHDESANQHRQQQLQFLERIEAATNRQQDYLQQLNQRLVGIEQMFSTLSRDLAKGTEHSSRLDQRLEALGFNLEQVRLLADASAQKQQQLVGDFIERQVTDHLFKQFLDIQFALTRYATNGNLNLKGDVQATAENIESFLSESGLRIINPGLGAAFDPREHQPVKVLTASSDVQADGTIAQTFTPGLCRSHRVIQPARVAVFKAYGVKPTNQKNNTKE